METDVLRYPEIPRGKIPSTNLVSRLQRKFLRM